MKLLQFCSISSGQYRHYIINDPEGEDFLAELSSEMRDCYLPESKIKECIEKGKDITEFITAYIPEKSKIKSGDFGEMLSFNLLKEVYLPQIMEGVKKWRYKENKDTTAHSTDILLFCCTNDPKPEDLLISAEVKTQVQKKDTYNIFQVAVDGAHKDSVSRLATALVYFKELAIKEMDTELIEKIKRFQKPVEPLYGKYTTNFKAIAVIDDDLLAQKLSMPLKIPEFNNEFEIIVLSAKNMRTLRDKVFNQILNLPI